MAWRCHDRRGFDRAAWNVQGDPARASFVDEVRRVRHRVADLPTRSPQRQTASGSGLDPARERQTSGSSITGKRDAISVAGGALFDASGSRVAWTVSGPGPPVCERLPARSSRAFAANTCAQSHSANQRTFVSTTRTDVHGDGRELRDVLHALVESAAQYGCTCSRYDDAHERAGTTSIIRRSRDFGGCRTPSERPIGILALGGALLAFIPGLFGELATRAHARAFVAPVLLDAAYDTSLRTSAITGRRYGLVVVAVG
jgi:hypothetical protein